MIEGMESGEGQHQMYRYVGSSGRKGSGVAFIVAFLAALFFSFGIPAAPASALCTFDENKFEPLLEEWRSFSAAEVALRDQPMSYDAYSSVDDFYDVRRKKDTDAVIGWAAPTKRKFENRRDRLIEAARSAYYRAKERASDRVQTWYFRNLERLGEARAVKIASAMWRRAKARLVPLAKRRDARMAKVRRACSKGVRGIVTTRRSVLRELDYHRSLIEEALDHRLELCFWDDQCEYEGVSRGA